MIKTIFVLGRQPELGLAELERVDASLDIGAFSYNVAVSEQSVKSEFINRLGGTMKLVAAATSSPLLEWSKIEGFIKDNLLDEIVNLPEGKINLGLSCYGLGTDAANINRLCLSLKKAIKSRGRSIRVVPNQDTSLSTAQVQHNKLTGTTGMEIVLVANQKEILLGKTLSIQDINSYASRDQARPKRDAKVGMLPPKLAQIMINLAAPTEGSVILDPFCGTGVVLQESLLMGHKVYGTDNDARMIEYSKANLSWLETNFGPTPDWAVETGDATDHKWNSDITTIVSEIYLGQPLFRQPSENELNKHVSEITDLLVRFLSNLSEQISGGTCVSLAVPAWRFGQGFRTLPILDRLEEIGYNHWSFKTVNTRELIYNRPQQLVARQLLVLIRK